MTHKLSWSEIRNEIENTYNAYDFQALAFDEIADFVHREIEKGYDRGYIAGLQAQQEEAE